MAKKNVPKRSPFPVEKAEPFWHKELGRMWKAETGIKKLPGSQQSDPVSHLRRSSGRNEGC